MSGGQTPGQQNSFQTQNTTSTSAPSPEIQDRLKNFGLGGLDKWYAANPNAPAYFPGQTVAPPSQATQSGYQTFRDIGTNGLGFGIDDASKQNFADTLRGKYLDPASNPAFQKYLAAGLVPLTQNLNENILPGIDSKFAGAGRT